MTGLIIRPFSADDDIAMLAHLVEESEREGFRFLRRLHDDYRDGSNRFDQPGEGLFAAWLSDRPVGVCGLNRDPYVPDGRTGRVRRLYVHPSVRQLGVGRSLVTAVIAKARETYPIIRLRTKNPAADAFYRRLGFSPVESEAATHVLRLTGPNAPRYSPMNIPTQVDVSRAILAHWGLDSADSFWIPARTERIVLWVVDGLGLGIFERAREHGLLPHYRRAPGRLYRRQSVFPTTTAAGMASLAFASPPAVHGALGYSVFVPEVGRRAALLTGLDEVGCAVPEDILYPRIVPTIFERVAAHGWGSAVVSPHTYQHSGFSRWLYAGSRYFGYHADNPLSAVEAVRSALRDPITRLVWLYWPYIDQAGHADGPKSAQMDQALSSWDSAYGAALHRWRIGPPVTMLITADHGMAALDPARAIRQNDPRSVPLWTKRWAGERRAVTTEIPMEAVLSLFGPTAAVYTQAQLWDEGWYGGDPVRNTWRDRVLHTLIVPPDNVQFQQDGVIEPALLKGGHGAMSPAERDIPLIVRPL